MELIICVFINFFTIELKFVFIIYNNLISMLYIKCQFSILMEKVFNTNNKPLYCIYT